MPKKKTIAKKINFDINDLGNGILRFFELLFKFILDVLKLAIDLIKLLPKLLKAVFGIIIIALFITLIAMIAVYFTVMTLGLKESAAFQEYRDLVIREVMIEHIEEMERIDGFEITKGVEELTEDIDQ